MVSFLGNTQSRWEHKDIQHDLRVVEDNSNTPFVKITSLEDGNVITLWIVKKKQTVAINANFQYSMDGVNWNTYRLWVKGNTSSEDQTGDEITIDYGQSVYFRNTAGTAIAQVHSWSWVNDSPNIISYHNFKTTKKFNVSGNVMAMINHNNLGMNLPSYGLCGLFSECKYLVDASNLRLPHVIGSDSMCNMFNGCSSLERAPILKFTSLYQFSLWNMFSNNDALSYIIWDSSCVFQKGTISSYVTEMTDGIVFYTKSNFDVETSKENLPLCIYSRWSFSPAIDSAPDIKEIEMAQSELFISKRFNLPDWMEVSR